MLTFYLFIYLLFFFFLAKCFLAFILAEKNCLSVSGFLFGRKNFCIMLSGFYFDKTKSLKCFHAFILTEKILQNAFMLLLWQKKNQGYILRVPDQNGVCQA